VTQQDGLLPDCVVAALGDERLREDEAWRSNTLPFLCVPRLRVGNHGVIAADAKHTTRSVFA
jgi:hypothetical protein